MARSNPASKALIPVTGVVLAAHAVVLLGLPALPSTPAPPAAAVVMETRMLQAEPPAPPAPAPEPAPPAPPAPSPAPKPRPRPKPATPPAATPPAPASEPAPEESESNQPPVQDWNRQLALFLEAIDQAAGPVIIVGNEIGLGVIPMGREVRAFVDALGVLNQQVAEHCESVTLMCAGLPLALKGLQP